MNTFRLLIGSPIKQRPEILSLFLHSLRRLDLTGISADYLFFDDNTISLSSLLLEQFAQTAEGTVTILPPLAQHESSYICDDITHRWPEEAIWRVAAMKDHVLQTAAAGDYTHVFLADSDLLFHPRTLHSLLNSGKDLVSAIFWTRWQADTIEMPQVWVHGEYSQYPLARRSDPSPKQQWGLTQRFYARLRRPGLYEVGGLGACTLISRHALSRGARFAEIPNLDYWGEDRHFCVRAAALGLSMHVETTYPAYHIYRTSDLPGASDYLRACESPIPERAAPASDLEEALRWIGHGYDEAAIESLERFLSGGKGTEDEQVTAYLELDACYGRCDDTELGLSLLRTADLRLSRAELSFRIGAKLMDRQEWSEAILWLARSLARLDPDGTSEQEGRPDWIWKPCIQLCVCYSMLGDWETAYAYNERGLLYYPGQETMLNNRAALLDKLNSPARTAAEEPTG